MSMAVQKASYIPTLDASNLTYQVERVRVNEPGTIETKRLNILMISMIPPPELAEQRSRTKILEKWLCRILAQIQMEIS